jgi:hypothetical protein
MCHPLSAKSLKGSPITRPPLCVHRHVHSPPSDWYVDVFVDCCLPLAHCPLPPPSDCHVIVVVVDCHIRQACYLLPGVVVVVVVVDSHVCCCCHATINYRVPHPPSDCRNHPQLDLRDPLLHHCFLMFVGSSPCLL